MVEEYLNKIKPYLRDLVNYVKQSDTWKILLTITNNYFFIDNDEECVMHSKSDTLEIMKCDEADEI